MNFKDFLLALLVIKGHSDYNRGTSYDNNAFRMNKSFETYKYSIVTLLSDQFEMWKWKWNFEIDVIMKYGKIEYTHQYGN